MKTVFITGANGFIGKAVTQELISHSYKVVGLTRSEEGAEVLKKLGAEPVMGTLADTDILYECSHHADAVIHTAFNHDFSTYIQNCEDDRKIIEQLGHALKNTSKPMLITSAALYSGQEENTPNDRPLLTSKEIPRLASDESALQCKKNGVNSMIIGLPQVHNTERFGLINAFIAMAQQHGKACYVGEGKNCWSAAHISDIAQLYRLILENGKAGHKYVAVAEEDIPFIRIAQALGEKLQLPVSSIPKEEAKNYFGQLGDLAQNSLNESGTLTRESLHWQPKGPSIFDDLAKLKI